MREILFRGKRIDNGEWVNGSVVRFRNIFDKVYTAIIPCDDIENYMSDLAPIDTETIGQYTGLCDKNGTKIFERDIVEIYDKIVDNTYYARVEFGNPNGLYNWGFQLVPLCRRPFAVEILHWVDMEDSGAFIEVIGNIHDNKKLIEEQD